MRMTAMQEVALERARQVAFPFADAVRKRDSAMVRRITAGLSWEEAVALAVVMAEAGDLLRLKAVKDGAT